MKKICFLLIAIALLSSCASIFYKTLLSPKVEEIKLVHPNTKDEVVFIPMVHIGYKSYYEDVARKVDSLNHLGYLFIYESVSSNLKDSVQRDLVLRKLRKVIGAQPSAIGQRVDTVNNLLFGQISYPSELDLVSQPDYAALNLNTFKSVCGDVPLETLMAAFEQKNGEIELSDCDFETGFEGDYDCSALGLTDRAQFYANYIGEYRDSILVENFLLLNRPKVAVIYGTGHFKGFYKRLRNYDGNWKVVKE